MGQPRGSQAAWESRAPQGRPSPFVLTAQQCCFSLGCQGTQGSDFCMKPCVWPRDPKEPLLLKTLQWSHLSLEASCNPTPHSLYL